MKRFFKKLVVLILARQIKKLRKKHQFKIIGVVGSIGKTSTKLAIAQSLGKNLRVRYQHGNYNDIVSVPLIFFGEPMPSLTNPIAWVKIFISNGKQIKSEYPYDAVVVEMGTDGPGQIEAFSRYLEIDFVVLTAIAPEHMENFKDMQAVANEELSVMKFSKQLIYNADLLPNEFAGLIPAGSISYSIKNSISTFHMANIFHSAAGLEADVKNQDNIYLHVAHEVVSETQLYSLLASIIIGQQFGLSPVQIRDSLAAISPVSGRLRRLRGINNSIIIDDTYNSSPEAVRSSLEALYKLESPQKIAIMGNMNELGEISAEAHTSVGQLCDPAELSLLITIGPDANKYLAPAAASRGCEVKAFDDPYTAGEFLQAKIEPGAVILAKGSQNGVFAEEAIKLLLADPEDAAKLVRQSDYWMNIKKKQFNRK